MKTLMIMAAALAASTTAQAQLLVAKGTKATLRVQYEYLVTGGKPDKYYPQEWQVHRAFDITVQLAANPQQPWSAFRPMEKQQVADMQNKQAHAAAALRKAEPTMNDMMKIVDKCGEKEACIHKAVTTYGLTQGASPQLQSARADIAAASRQDGPRYQTWRALSQTGTYTVNEMYRGQTADPACMERPRARCNRQENRKGGGELRPPSGSRGSPSVAQFEVDSVKRDVFLKLPVPLSAMTYTREVNSDFPGETSGFSQSVLNFPVLLELEPLTIAIPPDLRTLSGKEIIKVDGEGAEGGSLVVNWQFALQ